MPTSNPTDILLAHDTWATRNIIDACSTLTDEQFHQRFEMGQGSLHDVLTHVITVMRVWTDMLASREAQPRLEPSIHRSPAELRTLLDESAIDLARPSVGGGFRNHVDGAAQRVFKQIPLSPFQTVLFETGFERGNEDWSRAWFG